MKYFKFLFLLIITSSSFLTVQAQYLGTLSSFALIPSSDRITVAPNTTTTTVKFEVICFRQTASGSTNWAAFKMNFKLGTDRGGSKEILPTVYTMTSADFNPGVGSGSKQFTATISNSKLYNGAYLILTSNTPNVNNGGVLDTSYTAYTGSRYFINAPSTPPTVDPNIAKIQAMGFNTDGINDYGSFYVVEGDIELYKNALSKLDYTVNNTYNQNINISIDESVWGNERWYQSLLEALRVWNSTPGSNIKLNLVYLNYYKYAVTPRVDISIKKSPIFNPQPTESEFPKGNGNPGTLIFLDPVFNSPTGDNVLNLVHAIGHALGLKHTPTTAQGYQNSVMKKGNATVDVWSFLLENYGLPSTYDVTKISTTYPVNAGSTINAYINGPDTFNASASVTFRTSYISSEVGINYHWKVVGIEGTSYTSESYENNAALFDFGLPHAGKYQLQCTISGGKYTTPVTSTKTLTVL